MADRRNVEHGRRVIASVDLVNSGDDAEDEDAAPETVNGGNHAVAGEESGDEDESEAEAQSTRGGDDDDDNDSHDDHDGHDDNQTNEVNGVEDGNDESEGEADDEGAGVSIDTHHGDGEAVDGDQ